ncbi:MAG TPA: ribosomal protein S18-alanine N-acetyltransferase [Candidatus Limnocylindrales bacterium]|nr:ribosomal protein S18-alanine N-acetyltransferase [Candidatus Limnocylindrales bacterium]
MGSEGTARPGFVIREFDAVADAPEVAAILREAREAASWSEEALRNTRLLLGVVAFVSERGGAVSGIVVGRQVLDEAEILNLAVRQSARRQGEGRALVQRLLQQFVERQVSRVFLEVRESNAGAIAFYRKLGFGAVGSRKDYYRDPAEAATVMERSVPKSTV